MKTLVAYYSRTGNTKYVAEKIAEHLKGELSEVTDNKNRKGKISFLTGGYEAIREKLTEIEVEKNIEDYDFVIVGSPVWAGKIAPAIRTFLKKNDFSTKKVAFFVTVGGDKPNKALNALKEIISPQPSVGELGIINALKDLDQINNHIADWCKAL